MKPEDREDLLWQLSEIEDRAAFEKKDAEEVASDEQLRAYREGELSGAARTEVERLLRGNAENRRRLRALAKPAVDAAPEDIRRRFLESLGPAATDGGVRRLEAQPHRVRRQAGWRRLPRSARLGGLLAAAILVFAFAWQLVAPQLVAPRVPTEAPPAYAVNITALQSHRGDPPSNPGPPEAALPAEAFELTPVRIEAVVLEKAVAGVDIGLYRQDGLRLVRLDDEASAGASAIGPSAIRRETRQGTFELSAPAGFLVEGLGEKDLYVVVAWAGDLPTTVALEADGDPAETLASGGRRRVYPVKVKVLPTPVDSPEAIPERGQD